MKCTSCESDTHELKCAFVRVVAVIGLVDEHEAHTYCNECACCVTVPLAWALGGFCSWKCRWRHYD